MTRVQLDDVRVDLGETRALDGVSVTVDTGEWLGLIGPNGSGKTTLLRAVAGLVPSSGRIRVDGHDPTALSRRRLARLVAVVPQTPVLPPGTTVLDYVLLGRTPYIPYLGIEDHHDLEVVRDLLDRLDLGGLARRGLTALSGGERQRVVLARALAQQAPVLLLDEPTSALDVGHQQQVLELVDHLRRADGLTVVSAMHDLTVASQFADRLLLLARGRAVAHGDARAVLTERTIATHYAARVRVLEDPDGGVVLIPTRRPRATGPAASAPRTAPP